MRDHTRLLPGGAPTWRDTIVATFRRHDWRGFVRIYDWLKPRGGRREVQVRSRYGTQFLLSPWDSVDNHVLREGFYESEVLEAIRPALAAEGAVLWVIGANFGLHAITAKALHPAARVVAFEPSPAMAARILDNMELNQVAIELHAYALAATFRPVRFFANSCGNPGMSTIHPTNDSNYDQRFCVATLPGAQVIDNGIAPAPTAMIIDAEGAELEILEGLGTYLQKPSLERIVFEAPNEMLSESMPDRLLKSLRDAGFEVTKLERRENTAHSCSNFLASRPAR